MYFLILLDVYTERKANSIAVTKGSQTAYAYVWTLMCLGTAMCECDIATYLLTLLLVQMIDNQ